MKRYEYRMMSVEQRMEGAGLLLMAVTVLPLYGIGYGAFLLGKALTAGIRKERQRKRCEKIRAQRERQRLALREARKQEQRGANWVALRHAKAAFPSASPIPSPTVASISVL
ncbi:MAG: hypothetical protein FWF84_01510, partial [Kiritimatiellaeota bacterium]|nr:hypothetical protein [Kiritimatiellota bacterium]